MSDSASRYRLPAGLSLALAAAVTCAALLAGPAGPASAKPLDAEPALQITPILSAGEPAPPAVTADAAILMDMATGAVFYSRDADKQLPMASTTKIMTAMLVLESLELDKKVKVPGSAVGVPGSVAGLQRGETLTVRELMYALLVASGNDAAVTLAIAAEGSIDRFVARMNERAEELGLANTHFVNANGLHHERHYSSARDLAELSRLAMQDPMFRRIVDTQEYDLGRGRLLKNSNGLLEKLPWIDGIKTGSTPYADYCLVASGTRDGLTLISVILGARDDETRSTEALALLEYGFSLTPRTGLVDRGAVIAEIDVPDPLHRRVRLVTEAPLTRRVLGPDVVTGTVILDRQVTLPVAAGEVLGKLCFTQGGQDLGVVRLIAAQTVEKATIPLILAHWRQMWPPTIALERWAHAAPVR